MGNCLIQSDEIHSSSLSLNQQPRLTKARRVMCKTAPPGVNKKSPNDTDNSVALLFVGNSGVGKSTIVKQIQNLAKQQSSNVSMFDKNWATVLEPFTETERLQLKQLIHRHVLNVIGTLIEKSRRYGYHMDSFQHRLQVDNLTQLLGPEENLHETRNDVEITDDVALLIKRLLKDKAIRRTFDHHRLDFSVCDSFEYFMRDEKLTEISRTDYCPSVEDILRAHDEADEHYKDYNFKMADAYCTVRDLNGRSDEFIHMPKLITEWMNQYKCATTRFVVFVVSLADYNQKSAYHSSYTKLDESIKLLQVLVSIMLDIKDFKQTKLILLFNKTDVFQRKLSDFDDFDDFVRRYTKQERSEKLSRDAATDYRYQELAKEYVARLVFDSIIGSVKTDGAFCCRFLNATDASDVEGLANMIPKRNSLCFIGDLYD